MNKRAAFLAIGLVLIISPLVAASFGNADIRTFAAAVFQSFGSKSGGAAAPMSEAALRANGLTEVLPAEYVQITHHEGKSKNTKRLVTALADGSKQEVEVEEDAVVSIVTPQPGGHLYVPAGGSAKMQVKTNAQTGYDKSGI